MRWFYMFPDGLGASRCYSTEVRSVENLLDGMRLVLDGFRQLGYV